MFKLIKQDFVSRTTFLDDVLRGRATVDEIDDYIDRWHDAPGDSEAASMKLHEFLGMTWDEYRLWGEKPSSLRFTIAARRHQMPVDQVLRANLVGAAARSGDESDAEDVLQWLKDHGRIGSSSAN
jgi:hypothetical protein